MDVGNGLHIADKYFEPIVPTGLCDRNSQQLFVADPVKIWGCKARHGIIGKTLSGTFVVYFATNCTVSWTLTPEILKRIEKIDDTKGC